MQEYTIDTNSFNNQEYIINAEPPVQELVPPQETAPVAPAAPVSVASDATGDPDLAPGQKRPANAQKSIYGEIPQIPVLDAVEGIINFTN